MVSSQPTFLKQDLADTSEFIANHTSMILNPVTSNPLSSFSVPNTLFLKYPSYHQSYLEASLLEEISAEQPHFYQFFDAHSGFNTSILSVVVQPYIKGQLTSLLIRTALKEMLSFSHSHEITDVYLSYLGCQEGAIQKAEFFAILKNFLRENHIDFKVYLCDL